MNLTFFFGLNRFAASMRPMFPSLIRSKKERPHPRYFLALAHFIAQRGEQVVEVPLHALHGLPHLEDDLYPSQIHPQLTGKVEDSRKTLQIFVGIEPRIPIRSGGFQQPFSFVETESLRMHIEASRNDANHVVGFVAHHSS